MKVKFTLTMYQALVEEQFIDQLTMEWEADVSPEELRELSNRWLCSSYALTANMRGLDSVGDSSLTIEPLEDDIPNYPLL